jgi:hypothetical protein
MTPIIIEDWSEVEKLEREFAEQRAADLEAQMAPIRAAAAESDARAKAMAVDAQSKRTLRWGLAGAALLAGIGLAAFGASYLWPPKVQVVETEKVVTVEKPLIVEKQVVVEKPVEKIIEVPKIIEKPVPMAPPAPAPAPKVGEHSTPQQFEGSEEFRNSVFRGRVASLIGGEIKFTDGRGFQTVMSDGTPYRAISTTRYNGDLAYCSNTGVKYPDGSPRWECRVLHGGRIENPFIAQAEQQRPTQRTSDDPLEDLFGN